jgi:hypothetical protein
MATAQQTLNSPGKLTSTPAPTVTQLSPPTGFSNGGTKVTISGSDLAGATAVMFGQASGSDLKVNSDGTIITVTAPACSGTVDVIVQNQSGQSNATQFQFGPSIYITIDKNNNVSVNPENVNVAVGGQIQWVANFGQGDIITPDQLPFAVCFGNPLYPTPLMFFGSSLSGNTSATQIYTIPPALFMPGSTSHYSYKVVCMAMSQNGDLTYPGTDPVVIVSPS